jgi:3-hydroxybutyryl-CoA dehydratase
MAYEHKPFEAFAVGDRASFTKTITDADLLLFAAVSGDQYPLHVDEEYAKGTRFGTRIAHGMLTASLLSAANGLLLQRPGGISVAQTLHFRAPVFIGDTIAATSEVVEIIPATRRLRCKTTCVNQRGETVLEGEAIEQKDAETPKGDGANERAPSAPLSGVTLFADGGSRGNPGPAALGAVLVDGSGAIVREIREYLGTATNNVAEWRALIAGLAAALELGIEELEVRMDSELVVRQISGHYRVKNEALIPLHAQARSLIRRFKDVRVSHVPRKQNTLADKLVNIELDARAQAQVAS